MAHHGRRLLAERAHHPEVVGDVGEHPVGVDGRRLRRAAVAPNVDGRGTVTGVGQGGQLVAPRVPRLGKPVEEQHEGAAALLDDVDPHAVGRHDLMARNVHDGAVSPIGQMRAVAIYGVYNDRR